MDQFTPGLQQLLAPFASCFRPAVFATFCLMTAAWIVCLGRGLRPAQEGQDPDHAEVIVGDVPRWSVEGAACDAKQMPCSISRHVVRTSLASRGDPPSSLIGEVVPLTLVLPTFTAKDVFAACRHRICQKHLFAEASSPPMVFRPPEDGIGQRRRSPPCERYVACRAGCPGVAGERIGALGGRPFGIGRAAELEFPACGGFQD